MIIFGWGHQITKNLGPAFKNRCSHCNNEEYWVLTRFMTWFTLFFIPVFPYETKYFLSCPICEHGLVLNQKQIGQIKPLAEANQLLIDGKITQEEYLARVNQSNSDSSIDVEAEVVETKTLSDEKAKLGSCVNCGNGVTTEMKFCGNCGTQIVSK